MFLSHESSGLQVFHHDLQKLLHCSYGFQETVQGRAHNSQELKLEKLLSGLAAALYINSSNSF